MNAETPALVVSRRSPTRRGFTLMEAALATVIVGTGVMATMSLFGACTQANGHGARMTVAMMLATNVQEAMAALPFNDPTTSRATFGAEAGETLATYDDLDDFDGRTFNPPIDSTRAAVAELGQYSQAVTVRPIYPNQLSSNAGTTASIANTTYTGAARVTVNVTYRARPADAAVQVYSTSWVRLDR